MILVLTFICENDLFSTAKLQHFFDSAKLFVYIFHKFDKMNIFYYLCSVK